ncbi:MAG: hypothetical protein LAO08_07930 [Acidobacteriia bacterium]|nr:hypothetical protein [Terriglobia bacterium]
MNKVVSEFLTRVYMGKRGPKGQGPGTLYATACQWFWRFKRLREGVPDGVQHNPDFRVLDDGTTKTEWVFTRYQGKPAEPDVWEALLNARTAQDVQNACQRSTWWLNPKYGGGPGSPYPGLPALANSFLEAKDHTRYPRSKRPTSEESRMWFLAIALAAETWEIGLGRAINLLQTAPAFRKPEESKGLKEIMASTGGVTELVHPAGNYYTNGREFWRVPKQVMEK